MNAYAYSPLSTEDLDLEHTLFITELRENTVRAEVLAEAETEILVAMDLRIKTETVPDERQDFESIPNTIEEYIAKYDKDK